VPAGRKDALNKSTGQQFLLWALTFAILISARVVLAQDLHAVPATLLGATALAPAPSSVTAGEIVQRLIEHNQQRKEALRGYTEVRRYTVAYHGIGSLKASMTVEAVYDAPSTKHFVILSQSGSSLLVDHVLKRLLESEQEAARDPNEAELTPANYTFVLLGQETIAGDTSYVLHAEPKSNSKFLFRGKIYVDSADYAVTRIDAEPAKNPSFWIRKTEIHHLYAKTGQFWLPEQNHSETSVRLGGTADLTIDYGAYRIASEMAGPLLVPAAKPETTGIASR
jgi:hypothetical protein